MINLKALCALIIFLNIPLNISAEAMKIKLNPPRFKAENLQNLLEKRSSCRSFQNKALKLDDLATLLWATSGKKPDAITSATRTIPSAGATYPLELYVVVGEGGVDKLKAGIYHYCIEDHSLEFVGMEDKRAELAHTCLGQDFIEEAPVSLVITGIFRRTTDHYGSRGERYVQMEVGHACQNTYLSVTNLGLATVAVGTFMDNQVKAVLSLEKDTEPLIVMPVGYAK